MELQPKRQPGRVDRKAALFAAEIARLRSAGFTYEAIREALASVGVVLTESTLRREMRRDIGRETGQHRMPKTTPRTPTPTPTPTPVPVPSNPKHVLQEAALADLTPSFVSPPSPPSPAVPRRSKGHDIAEDFFKTHHTNPLLRTKETP